jgi:hypothetical protein
MLCFRRKNHLLYCVLHFINILRCWKKYGIRIRNLRSEYARALLEKVDKVPELREGFDDINVIRNNEELIHQLLADLFPTALTNNEIKAASIPFFNLTFNYTERFKNYCQMPARVSKSKFGI